MNECKLSHRKMRFFISYCENDGLPFASCAADILETYRHKAWYFDRDKTLGILRPFDISHHIRRWCDKVLYICTSGSTSSGGQNKEIAQWDMVSKQIIVIPVDGARVPDVIDSYIYMNITSTSFLQDFDVFVQGSLEDIAKHYKKWNPMTMIKNE